MTIDEASKRYQIPMEILKEYESWGLCGAVKKIMGVWQYDDSDLERLSMIMTLHDIGFHTEEIETYMRLLLEQQDTDRERLRMLERKRSEVLDEIHFRERQLDRLDHLRYKIRSYMEEKGDIKKYDWTLDERQSEAVIKRVLVLGINFFDTTNG